MLYCAGIIALAGLSAHFLDVGFDDDWCAKNIEKALACSNASGFGWERSEAAPGRDALAQYWKWNRIAIWHGGRPVDGSFAADEAASDSGSGASGDGTSRVTGAIMGISGLKNSAACFSKFNLVDME